MKNKNSNLLAIEIGSTRVKVAIFDEIGNKIISDFCNLDSFKVVNRISEYDPCIWLESVSSTVKKVIEFGNIKNIDGICVCSCGPISIFLDEKLEPVRNAIVWLDSRAHEESAFIKSKTGKFIPENFPAPVTLWIKNHETEIFKKIRYVVQPLDYITSFLVGEPSLSYASNEFTAFPDNAWNGAELSKDLLPKKYKCGELVGYVSESASLKFGIQSGIPVFSGTGGADVLEAILGANCLEKDVILNKTGTSEGLEALSVEKPNDIRFFSVPHPFIDKLWHIGAVMSSSGKALEWFKNSFYGKCTIYKEIEFEASAVKAGSEGLIFLPYIDGERFPDFNPEAFGIFYGISSRHTAKHFARAVMEGIGFALKQALEIFNSYGIYPKLMRVSGKPSYNDIWNKIKANILGMPVMSLAEPESELLGIAAIIASSLGIYENVAVASKKMFKEGKTFEPDLNDKDIYDKNFEVYKKLQKLVF